MENNGKQERTDSVGGGVNVAAGNGILTDRAGNPLATDAVGEIVAPW